MATKKHKHRPIIQPLSRETSLEAADAIANCAPILRARVLVVLATGSFTADEVAEKLGESILAIRPRCTELVRVGSIIDSGERRKNTSGRRATVWQLCSADKMKAMA